ncbi:MAG TPA: hypothetical protein VMT20_07065 [Terriglobia bacterium]|nr:hypothetical protein [Terriglobia bacterium]
MGELKASEVKYGQPLVTKLGPLLFTATQIEFPASAESITGGIELNLAKLGLTDEAVLGNAAVAGPEGAVGEVASTTQLPIAAWTSGVAFEAKTAGESAKQIAKATPVSISINANKLFLRFYVLFKATAAEVLLEEGTTANKAKNTVGGWATTIFCIGK